MKRNQNGFSHIMVIALITVVISVIGFVGYKVSKSNDTKLSTTNTTTNQKKATTEDATPPAEKLAQPEATTNSSAAAPSRNSATSTPPAPTPSAPPSPSPQKRVISFTKGGGGQQGTVVRVSANLSEAQQGTCTYKFSLNGTVRVEKTSGVTNSNQCFLDIPVSAFPKSAIYSFSLSFVSSNGLISASQSAYDIEVK